RQDGLARAALAHDAQDGTAGHGKADTGQQRPPGCGGAQLDAEVINHQDRGGSLISMRLVHQSAPWRIRLRARSSMPPMRLRLISTMASNTPGTIVIHHALSRYCVPDAMMEPIVGVGGWIDQKSTRLNSSHVSTP